MDKSENNSSLVGAFKWGVLGLIVLTAMFLFRDEIKQVLNRTNSIEISSEGFKIQTAQTPLGKADVSNVTDSVHEAVGESIRGNSYISQKNSFLIAWPGTGGWSASTTMGKSLGQQMALPSTITIPLVVTKNEVIDGFQPNVNVVVEEVGNLSINDYINKTEQSYREIGWQILSKDVDEKTQGGFISFYNNSFEKKLYQFQKIVIFNGKAYVITASQLPPENLLSQQLKDELMSTLNSFRTLGR